MTQPTLEVCEIHPSLIHKNEGVKTLVDAFANAFDTSRLFIKSEDVVGLEIHADAERISYHFIVPHSHSELLIPKIHSTFKGSSIHRSSTDKDTIDPAIRFTKNSAEPNYDDLYFVNLFLKHQAFLPLDMSDKASLFQELIGVLEQLRNGEKVWIQMLFQPVSDEWQEQFRQAYEGWLVGDRSFRGYGPKEIIQLVVKGFLDAVQNMTRHIIRIDKEEEKRRAPIKTVQQKLTQAGFKSCIRMMIDAKGSRKYQLARGLTAAYRTLSAENDFIMKSPWRKKPAYQQMMERKMPRLSVSHQVLCSSEIAAMVKMPDEHVDSPKLKRMAPEEMRVDEAITKEGMHIGHTINTPREKVHFSVKSGDDIARTRLFVASPGGGKSTLIEQLIHEAARHGHGCAAFDVADGRLYERIIAMNPEYADRILSIDFTDKHHPPAFNFSALGDDDETRGLMFGEFFEQLFKTEDLARTQSYMLKAAMAVFSESDSTLLEFIDMLRSEEYRAKMLPKLRVKKPDLYLWWTREFPKVSENKMNEIIAPILVRLDTLLYNHRIRNILCQRGGRITPGKWMEEGKIVVFNLSGGSFTEPEQRMLMSLLNSSFWNATLAREELTRKNIEPRPFHLIYDEPQTYMGATPMFDRAISKARKYRVSCNFFIQEAEQIIKEAPDLWKKILGMSPHLMVGPVSETTAKHVCKELNMKVEQILDIKKVKYAWILRTFHDKAAVNPFVLQTVLPRDQRPELKGMDFTKHIDEVKKRSRSMFCTMPLHQLNEEINARSMNMSIEQYHKALTVDNFEEDKHEEGAGFTW